MTELLDTPAWSALASDQRNFLRGNELAVRYDPEVALFAAARDNSAPALKALDALVKAEEQIFLAQRHTIELPDTLKITMQATATQLVKTGQGTKVTTQHAIHLLGPADIDDMLELTALTKPGPFLRRTPEMGNFWGIRIDGRLTAMTGQRFAMPGYREVSGVCSHPDFRGQGLAAALSSFVIDRIEEEGRTPFLHAYADNDGALKLYAKLGFTPRADLHAAIVKRR